MDWFQFVLRYFWVALVIATIAQSFVWRARSRRHIAADPSLEAGYRTLIWGQAFWLNIPWLIMGLGCTVGGVPTFAHFLRPRDGDPWVTAFFVSVFALWLLGTYWLFARRGAEMLARHPGMFNVNISSPKAWKILWCTCLLPAIAAVIAMFIVETPIP